MFWRLAGECAREEARLIAADVVDEPPCPAPVIPEAEAFAELFPAAVEEESQEVETVDAPTPVFDIEAVEASAAAHGIAAVAAALAVTTDPVLDEEAPWDLETQTAAFAEGPLLDPAWLDIIDELEKPDLDPPGSLPPPLDFTGANENLEPQAELGDAGDLAAAA
jgi:hypothetical protein